MLSESAAARRRRRVYHQRSLQCSGGSIGQYTEQLIPEADNEDDDEDDDLQQDERTSLIRPVPGGSGSPRASGAGARQLHLQHQHSAPSGDGDWGLEDYLEYQEQPVVAAGGGGGGDEGDGDEEGMRDEERLASRRQQLREQYRAPPVSPHSPRARRPVQTSQQQQQQQTLAAPAASAAAVPGGAVQVAVQQQQQQREEEDSSSMTITPAAQRSSSTSSTGSAAGRVERALSPSLCTASAAVVAGNASNVASGVSSVVGTGCSSSLSSPPPTGGTSFSHTGGGAAGGAASGGGGGGAGGGAPRTPVIKKRTRFHQRSVTMMPATSPITGPGVVSDDVGLIDKDDRHGHHHHSLDLAATYHSGVSSSSSHRHQHHRGKTTGIHQAPSRQQHHIGGAKTSTPSLLFTKVKERIREKVFQSSEWPNAAAMMHEKRQRANDLLEASLNSRTNLNMQQIQLHDKQRKKMMTTLRCKSDSGKYPTSAGGGSQPALYADPLVVAPSNTHPTSVDTSAPGDEPSSPDKEVVRDAFRRRSISEDTYDRQPCVVMKKNGVVCSNEDLEVIMQEQQSIHNSKAYKAKRSPRPLKKHLRTQSLDIARLQARENQQGAGQTSHSSIYLDPQVSMESSSSTVSSVRTIDSASSEINLRLSNLQLDVSGRSDVLVSPGTNLYPEIVLDDKSKEIIMETKDGQASDSISLDEEDSKSDGKKKSKPVPEIIFDENGQTWDVYGAEFDPEVLGYAIQRHLEKMMERMMAPTMTEEDPVLAVGSACSAGTAESQVESSKTQNSFWVRLLCLFAGRNEVAT